MLRACIRGRRQRASSRGLCTWPVRSAAEAFRSTTAAAALAASVHPAFVAAAASLCTYTHDSLSLLQRRQPQPAPLTFPGPLLHSLAQQQHRQLFLPLHSRTWYDIGRQVATSPPGKSNKLSTPLPIVTKRHRKMHEHCDSQHSHRHSLNITKWGLSEWSNFAAILCALDCTLLPLLTAAIPLAGFVADTQHLEAIHTASRWVYLTLYLPDLYKIAHVAMYVVLPLGGFAVAANYIQLRKRRLLLMGVAGLFLVLVAHAGCSFHDHGHEHMHLPAAASQKQESPSHSHHEQHLEQNQKEEEQQDATQGQQEAHEETDQQWYAVVLRLVSTHHTLVSLIGAGLLLCSNFLSHRLKHRLGHHDHCCSKGRKSHSFKKKQLEMGRGDREQADDHDTTSLLGHD
ncbi:activating signal cointegrator 1 complex subunit [Cyclospora cayetanensis]|uniref:Activating signal cointegrator 1 complex subunit n=1 Tax=Cyclospora cayetanensis TaxID=88456 RepID=A0A1D3CUW2_9EIME|nr:activating signal cointegrator 1 complex subunit [Cyclospora cayetanensis]